MQDNLVEVVFPLALRHTLTYRVPENMTAQAQPGQRVCVPLGSKKAVGIVLKGGLANKNIKLKNIESCLDEIPLLTPVQLSLLTWASAYYLTPLGEVLKHLIPPHFFEGSSKNKIPKPRKIAPTFSTPAKNITLTGEQAHALKTILHHLDHPTPLLLHGITGSGKTDVYLKALQQVVSQGNQGLILVPEISLTPQIMGRLLGHFESQGIPIRLYHSALTPTQRSQVWHEAKSGQVSLVVSTRSGIFLPFKNLKMIVIDEEHDASYKQEERFCYNARDLAFFRGEQEKCLVLAASATPSVESHLRVLQGKMKTLRLTERPQNAILPTITAIDRRQKSEREGHPLFSETLLRAIESNLLKKEQTLLFLNRRGFAPSVFCPLCGLAPTCTTCDITLTLHQHGSKNRSELVCHYCDERRDYTPKCSDCEGIFIPQGYGTERVMTELKKLFPLARSARLDRDTAQKDGWFEIFEKMNKREIDILVGTQMITKGFDFPHVTLVGILDADQALHIPDFRAAERTFQLITQVAGRSGRAEKPGRVFVQTYRPDHATLIAAVKTDEKSFYAQEILTREEALYPPFCRLIEIRLTGVHKNKVIEVAGALSDKLAPLDSSVEILGPAPCPLEKIRGKVRWRLLLKVKKYAALQPKLQRLLDEFAKDHLPSAMKMLVNVDPIDMV